MQKILTTFLIILITSLSLFAQSESDSLDDYFKVDRLLDDDLEDNFLKIRDLSKTLSFDYKDKLYGKYQMSSTLPLLLNLLVPFGVGSFVQKDIAGGVRIAVFDGLTLGASYIGLNLLYFYDVYNQYSQANINLYYIGLGCFAFAAATEIISIIFKISGPLIKTKKVNKELKNALRLSNDISFKVIPGLDLTSTGKLKPQISVSLSY